jgi:hypothetical protein
MAVDSTHPQYDFYAEDWRTIRDHVAGSRRVKEAGARYLPMLGDPTNSADQAEYDKYKKRAMYYPGASRTKAALLGSVMRVAPTVSDVIEERYPDALKAITDDGRNFRDLAQQVIDETIEINRCGVLVDMPARGDVNTLPYLVMYSAEQIINWRYEYVDGQLVKTLVVLREEVVESGPDMLDDPEEVTRYRALMLAPIDPEEPDGPRVYRQQIWEEVVRDQESGQERRPSGPRGDDSPQTDLQMVEEVFPMRRGELLTEIPFFFSSTLGDVPEITKSILMDVVDVNISHYQSSADLEHGRHYVALPTPWVAGFDVDENQPLVLGPSSAWVTENTEARAGMLEFTGSGLSALESALEHKERLMATLGARLLEQTRAGVETAETARIRQSGEQSALSNVSDGAGSALTEIMRFWGWWAGMEDLEEVEVTLNRDFVDSSLAPAEVTALVNAYLSGALSYDTLFENLKKGEIVAVDADMEEERDKILSDPIIAEQRIQPGAEGDA